MSNQRLVISGTSFLAGLLLLLQAHTSSAVCGRPTEEFLEYGFLARSLGSIRAFNELQVVKVWCKAGGFSKILCRNDQWQWTPSEGARPRCNEIPRCEPPPTYNYTKIEPADRRNLGQNIVYTCMSSSFEPVDINATNLEKKCKEKRRCREGQRNPCKVGWSNKNRTFHCKVKTGKSTCYAPEDPQRVWREIDSELEYPVDRFEVGDYIRMKCKPGYKSKTEDAECLENGKWDTDNGEIDLCKEPTCTPPEPADIPADVSLTSERKPYRHLDKMRVKCDRANHRFRGQESNILAIPCTGNARHAGWAHYVPPCEAIKCPFLIVSEHGHMNQKSISHVGDTATLQCYVGQVSGSHTRWCTQYGTWNGTLQRCIQPLENGCGDPGTPAGGIKMGNQYYIGDVVTFRCNDDRILLGSSERVCEKNKEWSGTQTECRGKGEFLSPEQGVKGMNKAVLSKGEDTTSSELFQETLDNYQGKAGVYIGNVKMETFNRESRTSLGEFSKNGLDLYLLFDSSGSISREQFNIAISFAKLVVRKLGVSSAESGTKVSYIAFNSEVWSQRLAQDGDTLETIMGALDEMGAKKPNGSTSLEVAMTSLINLIAHHRHALRKDTSKASQAVLLFSDGVYNVGKSPVGMAKDIKRRYGSTIEFFSIGVGNVDMGLLKNVSSSTGPEHLVYLRDYRSLEAMDRLFNASIDFSRCGDFINYRNVFDDNATATEKFWPWMVGVYETTGDKMNSAAEQLIQSKHSCGASLINPWNKKQTPWLLTAAHCVKDKNAGKFVVKIGSPSSDPYLQDEAIKLHIKRHIIHTGYNAATLQNDIALLELETPVIFAAKTRPVCLPTADQLGFYAAGQQGEATGWGGKTPNADSAEKLKTVEVKITDIVACRDNLTIEGVKRPVNDGWNFCAGNVPDPNGKKGKVQDTCQGDSGGPLVIHIKNELGDDTFIQTGIVSFGHATICGKRGVPGVYTNVAKFVNWIKEETREK